MVKVKAQSNGQPAGRAYVSLRSEDGVRVASSVMVNGNQQLGPVLPGSYRVRVKLYGDDKSTTTQTVTVAGEPSVEVVIEM